jgi:DNA (cytosine-5)-methyltransferase 1
LAGYAPCQPFSSLLKRNKKKNKKNKMKKDSRVSLLSQFGKLIFKIKPDFVFVENVPGLKNGRGKKVFKRFENKLKKGKYSFISEIVDTKDYGVPQRRKRLVLLASRHGNVEIPETTHGESEDGKLSYVTVKDAIKKFPIIRAGTKHEEIKNHEARTLSNKNKERLGYIKINGGSRTDLPRRLVLECHEKHKGHTDAYGRMRWDEVAPALTCKCTSLSNGRFGHPSQTRAISVREAAALQTFRDNYTFYGSLTDNSKWVGNAVPVRFAKKFGCYFIDLAEELK